MTKKDNYKENLLDAMKASSEERKREQAARKHDGKWLFIVVVSIIAVVAIVVLIAG